MSDPNSGTKSKREAGKRRGRTAQWAVGALSKGSEVTTRGISGLERRSRIWPVGRPKAGLTAPTHLYPPGCASLEPEKGTCPAYWP